MGSLDAFHSLLVTIVLGSYVYITGAILYFQKRLDTLTSNHLQHLVNAEVTKQLAEQSLRSGTEPESLRPE